MPGHLTPTSFTCGREGLKINGVTYHAGDDVPVSAVKQVHNLSALVSRRDLIPDTDPHGRRTRPETPTPTEMSGMARRALVEEEPA